MYTCLFVICPFTTTREEIWSKTEVREGDEKTLTSVPWESNKYTPTPP